MEVGAETEVSKQLYCTILINIGRIYGEMNNKIRSKEYLDRVIKIGNQNEKQRAQYYKGQYGL